MTVAALPELSVYVPIRKIDAEQRLVFGICAAEVKDNAGEVFDYETSKPYFQKWSDNAHATSGGKSRGNLRVMHTSKVAGVLTDLAFNDDAKTIECCAKVVDDDEWKKVEAGCYTGFSMGGRYVKRLTKGTEKRYTADPCEMSLVDKPCIPSATFDIVKADGLVETRHFDDSVLLKGDDQPRDELGRFASDGGGDGGAGNSDPSGHGTDAGGTKAVSYPTVAPMSTAEHAKTIADKEAKAVKNDPAKMQQVADRYRRVADNYDKSGVGKGGLSDTIRIAATDLENRAKGVTKSDNGDMQMYVPTNDEMLPVAKALAKAATGNENDWLDHMDAARADLVAKHDGGEPAPAAEPVAAEAPAADPLSIRDLPDLPVEKGDNPFAGKGKDDAEEEGSEDDDTKAKKKPKEGEEEEEVEKAAAPELEQGWKAKDGTFFLKKADAIAHNDTLAKADADPSMADQLRQIASDAEKLAKGEALGDEEPVVEDGGSGFVSQDEDLTKYADLLAGALPLRKGMYEVSRMADALRSAASLQISVAAEAKREGDGSGVPATLLEAVTKMGEAMIAMAKEEVEELTASLATSMGTSEYGYPDAYCALAHQTLGLEKSHLDEMSAARGVAAPETVEQPLAKLDDATEAKLAKFDAMETELEELKPLVKSIQTQFEELKKRPMPPAPRTSGALEKSDTSEAPQPRGMELLKGFDAGDLADAAIRMAQSNGRHFVNPGARS